MDLSNYLGGDTVKDIQNQSQARVHIAGEPTAAEPNVREITLVGSVDAVTTARKIIEHKLQTQVCFYYSAITSLIVHSPGAPRQHTVFQHQHKLVHNMHMDKLRSRNKLLLPIQMIHMLLLVGTRQSLPTGHSKLLFSSNNSTNLKMYTL